VDRLGERVERDTVLERKAEHVGDHVGRHQPGDIGDQVTGGAVDHPVDDAGSQLLDARTHRLGGPGDELRSDGPAQRRVPRRVGHEHHLVLAQVEPTVVGDHHRGGRRERGRVASHGLDVAIAGDRPEPIGARLGVPVHRIVRPQPRELVMRLTPSEGGRRQQVDVDHPSSLS
jgi:hypothetical protein